MIVLVGFMGSGKTTVARMLAARLGLRYVDTDAQIEREEGRSIADIFSADGEPHFRALERVAVTRALIGPDAVVSLGGGAVLDPDVQGLLQDHLTVFLDVDADEAVRRVGGRASRPLLEGTDPAELYASRRPVYEARADMTVDTTGRPPHEVAAEIAERVAPTTAGGTERRVEVMTGAATYRVTIGAGNARRIAEHVAQEGAEKAFLITHPSLLAHGADVVASLQGAGLETHVLELDQGEGSKSLDAAARLYGDLAAAGAHRTDLVVTFGGGVVGDVGGFVASTYMRGLRLVHVPSTLLAQVDAAIGGKTGVNLARGKNLVGTIYQPSAVVCDVELLRSCPREEIRSGLAEVLKYGFIADPSLIDLVMAEKPRLDALDDGLLIEIVARCAAVKASVVATDERETGDRAYLNYGHTFGHAIETVRGFGAIRHGEAVALGMMAAAYTAAELGWIGEDVVSLHRSALSSVDLPVSAELDQAALEAAWQQDKKYAGGVRFVLLKAMGCPEAGVTVPDGVLRAALARLARED